MVRLFSINACEGCFSLGYDESSDRLKLRSDVLENSQALGKFLSSIEKRAFRRAQIATGNIDEALDIVQDAMFSLVNKYASKGPADWELLFHRILSSRIMDWHRRNSIRKRIGIWFHSEAQSEEPFEVEEADENGPEQQIESEQSMARLERVLNELPLRQQQVFLLRAWEGFSEKETARAMSCSVGTVKAHYSRARSALKEKLTEE